MQNPTAPTPDQRRKVLLGAIQDYLYTAEAPEFDGSDEVPDTLDALLADIKVWVEAAVGTEYLVDPAIANLIPEDPYEGLDYHKDGGQ